MSCSHDPSHESIWQGLEVLGQAERVYWHNGIGFDVPALAKVYGEEPHDRSVMRDTQVIAQMRWAHISKEDHAHIKSGKYPGDFLAGSHRLKEWGIRLGIHKGEYTDWCKAQGIKDPWSTWRPEMQTYCEQDTAVGRALVLKIREAGVTPESQETEHELAWYLAQQQRNGWPFDREKAIALQARLVQRREELSKELIGLFGSWLVPDGTAEPKVNNKTRGITKGASYSKMKLVEFNPTSRQHIANRLQKLYGWKPTEYSDNGDPKVDDDILSSLPYPPIPLLTEYLVVAKRLGQISEGNQAWLHHARTDGPEGGAITGMHHIHGRVKQNHAITHRAAHASPNTGQVPKVGSIYGAECRELWRVPAGWVQVGADAASLEARCLGHYMAKYDDGAYAKMLLSGDVHTANRISLGLPGDTPEVAMVARSGTKNWYYAFMYGAWDDKLGSMLVNIRMPDGRALIEPPRGGWTKQKIAAYGKAKKEQFLENTPALGQLISDVKFAAATRGYVTAPDGRRTYIRSDHAALNSLIQSAGAVICKRWIVHFNRALITAIGPQGWNGKWAALGWVHDEVQIATRPEIAEEVGTLLVTVIRGLTHHFRWRVPLDGEYKIGGNWKECH